MRQCRTSLYYRDMPITTRETVDQAEHLAYVNPGCTIVLKDIPEQWVPAKYRRLRQWMHQMKFDNGSKITLHTLPF